MASRILASLLGYILCARAGGNFSADERDRFIQELDELREVAAIRHFTVSGDDDRVVVDPAEYGGKRMDDSLDVSTADHTGLAEENVSDSDHIRVRKVNDRVAVCVAVRVMIEFNILSREVNGEHVAKSYDWPSALRIWTDRRPRPEGNLLRYQPLSDVFLRNNDRCGAVNRVTANMVVMPVGVQKKLHWPLSHTVQGFLNCRICSGFGVIHEQVTARTREYNYVKRGLRGANLNKANVAAYRKNLGLCVGKVRITLLEPLSRYGAAHK